MTLKIFKRAASAVTAAICVTAAATAAIPFRAGAVLTKIVTINGYDYEYWIQSDTDLYTFSPYNNGGFYAAWNAKANCFFSKGLINTRPASKDYTVSYDLSLDYTPNSDDADSCVYVCAYGALSDPPAEFFFTDLVSNEKSFIGENSGFEDLGSFVSDGKSYELYYKKDFVRDINGGYYNEKFISLRKGGEMTDSADYYMGKIDVGAHFEAYKELGKDSGTLDRLSLNIEAYKCRGEAVLASSSIKEKPAKDGSTPAGSDGTIEKNGCTYSYSSSCKPEDITLKVYDNEKDGDFIFSWPEGKSSITKTLLSEPVKSDKNTVALFREDYSFTLNGGKTDDSRFSGILEMDLNGGQKVFIVDAGTGISAKTIADMYAEKGINAELTSDQGSGLLKLRENRWEVRPMNVFPFTYTVKNDGTDEKHTDYWLTDYQCDTYMLNHGYRSTKISPDRLYRSCHIYNAADILSSLEEYGLSADTIESASFEISSEDFGCSLEASRLSMDVSLFPAGPYYYSVENFHENDFSFKPNDAGMFDFTWENKDEGNCYAEAGRHFDGKGLDLTKVESITVDYSGVIDFTTIDESETDYTSVSLHGFLPLSDNTKNEFRIDLAYLKNDDKMFLDPPMPDVPVTEDNGTVYEIYMNKKNYSGVSENVNDIYIDPAESASVNTQYWSVEQVTPVKGDGPTAFSGTIDLTKHIAAFKAESEKYVSYDHKFDLLNDLAICVEGLNSRGSASIGKFVINIKYKDGITETYTPEGAKTSLPWDLLGDLNGDKRIDSFDVALCRRELLSAEGGKAVNELADMDKNGSVQLNDLVLMTSFVLGKSSSGK